MNKFKEKFNKTVIPEMNKKFGYKNALAAPKIIKVVVSAGIGSFKDEAKKEAALKSFTQIVGQKPLGQQSQEINSFIQVERRNGCGLFGDIKRPEDV